jgi:alanine-alpha-ketoisovalerate/valine-pyruvate aminotransferase
LLLLLLTLPAAAQAQFSCTINNDAITITQFAISQYFSLLTVQMGRLTNGTQNQHCL